MIEKYPQISLLCLTRRQKASGSKIERYRAQESDNGAMRQLKWAINSLISLWCADARKPPRQRPHSVFGGGRRRAGPGVRRSRITSHEREAN
jgi:hypothetical protein